MRRSLRRISPKKARWAAVSAVALLGAGLVFPVAAGAGRQHGRDLVVHLDVGGLGTPPHILVGASGTAPRFRVEVTTSNEGDVATGPSTTALIIKSGALTRVYQWRVPGLAPRGQRKHTADHTVVVENLEPDLGFTEVKAQADYHRVVSETNKRNNEQKTKIAVEPREWDVPNWFGEDAGSGADNVTRAGEGFYLRFQEYDGGFVYQAYGPVTDTPKKYPGCASVSGSKTVTQTPWAGSNLKINSDLRSYSAFVPTSSNNFFASCNFANASFQIQVAFVDLSTGGGPFKKDPEDTVLEGTDSTSTPGGTQGWGWTFRAHLPKR